MDDELAGLLAGGERAAFRGRPASGITPLRRAVEVAQATGRETEATAAVWLLGVCLGASGRYGAALSVLQPLAAHDSEDRGLALFASLASSTVASLHRQLGRHADGREHDTRALDRSGDAADAQFDARLGLAADAVGLGEVRTARAELEGAAEVAEGRHEWWRQRVRLDWVRAEVALLGDDAAAAASAAAAAVARAESSGAPRHVAKGLLFLGVAQVELGDELEAAATLRRAASLADSVGALPVVWPARAVLGALLAPTLPDESERALAGACTVVRQIASDLPADLAAAWLARPDLAELLAGRPD